jgi:hypothetical protein
MSIAAMVDNEVAKSEKRPPVTALRARSARAQKEQEPEEATSRTSDVVGALVSYVPAEAIAAYVLLLPFMDPSSVSQTSSGEQPAHSVTSFSGRWGLLIGVAVLAVVYAVGYRKIAAIQAQHKFAFPWIPVFATLLAFAAWVFAIPDSPFNDFGFYTPELGAAAGTVAATFIAFVAAVTGETLTFAKAQENGDGG